MKELLLQIAGVKTEAEFYKKFPTQEAFFEAHPEAEQIIAEYKQQQMMSANENEMMSQEAPIAEMAKGGLIKRKDGSYSKRGLWDNIRANKGSGKKPTKQMLEQAKKIQAEEMMYGGMVDEYLNGGGINNPGFKALPKEVQENIIANMAMGGDVEEYANGGYTVRRSNDRKGKTHVVIGPDGTKKYFGDPKMGEKGKSKYGKEAFYARHRTNLKNNPYFRAYARATWADGGVLPDIEQLMLAGQDVYEMGGMVEYPTYYPGGGIIAGPMMGYEDDFIYAMGGGINIKPENKGKFTEWAKRNGMSVSEAANKVMANTEDYSSNVVKMANFAKNAAKWKKEMGGFLYQDGGEMNVNIGNNIPVQTETYQGQPEQVVLPDGTIDSVNAKTSHENMSDGTVTDVLPSGSHIQSSRNKLTPEQYDQLINMFTPEVAKERMKQIEQITKGKNKKLSPAEISEYAKKNYQKKSTPNSFDTDKLKEGNKKSYIDLSIQMNDLIKAGKELAEGVIPQDMMAWGGMIPKFNPGGIVEYTGGKSKTPTGKSNKYNKDKSYLTQWKNAIENIENLSNEEAQRLIYDYTLKTNPEEVKNMWSNYGLTLKGRKSPILSKKYPEGKVDASKLTENDLKELREAYIDGFFGARQLENKFPVKTEVAATPAAVVTTTETPAQKAENIALGNVNPINPLTQMQGRNRFNTGLLESQLARGLQGNQAYLNAAMQLSPVYTMETPDTFIRSRRNEIPVGNILYNIERAQRNTANALANQTGDWSTLASNIANAGATAMNQVGDTLSALNRENINLYNTTQGLQQDLLSSNVGVRNQNLTNMQNMLNYKRNLFGQKAVKDAELYSKYASSMGENAQKEQNQKLEMLSVMASKPDMFKGQQGQDLMNSVMNTYGSYNNLFAGSPLDFGLNLFNNRRIL